LVVTTRRNGRVLGGGGDCGEEMGLVLLQVLQVQE
jgi:hypothetical protein